MEQKNIKPRHKFLTSIDFWESLWSFFIKFNCSSALAKWLRSSSSSLFNSAIFFSYIWVVSASAFWYLESSDSCCWIQQKTTMNMHLYGKKMRESKKTHEVYLQFHELKPHAIPETYLCNCRTLLIWKLWRCGIKHWNPLHWINKLLTDHWIHSYKWLTLIDFW